MDTYGTELTQIEQVLGLRRQEELSPDEVLSWLSQVTIALLIVFIIANFLFAKRAELATKDAKDNADYWWGRWQEVENTPAGTAIAGRDKALIDLQKQKLLITLEKTEFDMRRDYGIVEFVKKDVDGKNVYLMDDIISEGKIISKRLQRACLFAHEAFSDQKRLENEWFSRILFLSGMVLNDSAVEQSTIDHPEIVSKKNTQWLMTEIRNRTAALYAECCDMQNRALAHLIRYYIDHTDALEGTEISKQTTEAPSPEERKRLVSSFSRELYKFIKSLFEDQKVPLLKGV